MIKIRKHYHAKSTIVPHYLHKNPYAALAESEASHQYLHMDAESICEEVREIRNGLAFKVATGTVIEPHLQAKLTLAPEISKKSQRTFLFGN